MIIALVTPVTGLIGPSFTQSRTCTKTPGNHGYCLCISRNGLDCAPLQGLLSKQPSFCPLCHDYGISLDRCWLCVDQNFGQMLSRLLTRCLNIFLARCWPDYFKPIKNLYKRTQHLHETYRRPAEFLYEACTILCRKHWNQYNNFNYLWFHITSCDFPPTLKLK